MDLLGDILWSLGRLKARQPELVATLCSRAQVSLRGFEAEDLANLTWACASLNHAPRDLMTSIARRLSEPGALEQLSVDAYGDLLWGITTLRFYDADLMDALVQEFGRKLEKV